MSEVNVIDHPDTMREGLRVITVVQRRKDGVANRTVSAHVTGDLKHFSDTMNDLIAKLGPGQRIYASASPRDGRKSVRLFRMKQLDSEYNLPAPHEFYLQVQNITAACFGDPYVELEKIWLFDLDDDVASPSHGLTIETIQQAVPVVEGDDATPAILVYAYDTKNGRHVLTRPFDTRPLAALWPGDLAKVIHKNPSILWAYRNV